MLLLNKISQEIVNRRAELCACTSYRKCSTHASEDVTNGNLDSLLVLVSM